MPVRVRHRVALPPMPTIGHLSCLGDLAGVIALLEDEEYPGDPNDESEFYHGASPLFWSAAAPPRLFSSAPHEPHRLACRSFGAARESCLCVLCPSLCFVSLLSLVSLSVSLLTRAGLCLSLSLFSPAVDVARRACRRGWTEIVEVLLAKQADVGWRNPGGGWTALHRAAYEGHTVIVRLLIARGAAIDVRNDAENTPVHWAAENGHITAVTALLELGADATVVDDDGLTPRDRAEEKSHLEVAALLPLNPEDQEIVPEELRTLGRLATDGNLTGVTRRLQQGVNPNHAAEFAGGNSPLYWAALAGHAAVITVLCENGADPGWKDPISGMTPLHRAASMGHAEAVRALVGGGAPIDARDKTPTPCTPLQNAAMRGRSDVREALLVRSSIWFQVSSSIDN